EGVEVCGPRVVELHVDAHLVAPFLVLPAAHPLAARRHDHGLRTGLLQLASRLDELTLLQAVLDPNPNFHTTYAVHTSTVWRRRSLVNASRVCGSAAEARARPIPSRVRNRCRRGRRRPSSVRRLASCPRQSAAAPTRRALLRRRSCRGRTRDGGA